METSQFVVLLYKMNSFAEIILYRYSLNRICVQTYFHNLTFEIAICFLLLCFYMSRKRCYFFVNAYIDFFIWFSSFFARNSHSFLISEHWWNWKSNLCSRGNAMHGVRVLCGFINSSFKHNIILQHRLIWMI